MVKYSHSLDTTFHALADGTRRDMLARLANGDARVTDLAEPYAMSLPAISKHLDVLERAGLILRTQEGRVRRCSLQPGPLADAEEWIQHYRKFWESRLEALDKYLKKIK